MPVREEAITLYLGPATQGGPDDLLEPVIDFIDRCRRRQQLMIAVQELDNLEIAQAIVRARRRGVTIDLVIEQDYILGRRVPLDAFVPGGANERNREIMSAILRASIDLKCDFNSSIFHQKFMVCGNRVLTGSTNFTDTGTHKNLNHIVVVHDRRVAAAYRAEFAEIRRGSFGRYSVSHDDRPKEHRVAGIRVKPLFAPDHGPEMEIMKQILKARKRIDFAIFTFAQSSGIDDALLAAHDRGVRIRGVFDSLQVNQTWAASHGLKAARGIDVQFAGNSGGLGKLHHKMMVIDDHLLILGSFNYTGPANKLNDENILILGDLEEQAVVSRERQGRLAQAARREIDRIRRSFGTAFR